MTQRPAHVLVNVWEFTGNTYPSVWRQLLTRAGATVTRLTRQNLVDAPRGAATVVHLQWPEVTIDATSTVVHLRKALSLARLVVRARLRGNRVLTTMHNVHPHDRSRIATAFWFFLSWTTTDVHVLDRAGWPQIAHRHPGLKRARLHEIPHMNYLDELNAAPEPVGGPRTSRGAALLYFGGVRAYKGIESLLDVVTAARGKRQWSLTLLGRAQDQALADRILAVAADDDAINARLVVVDHDDLEAHIRRSDLVVLPYTNVLNSGSLIMALSVGTPVLVPDTPTFASIGSRVGPGWITTYTGSLGADDIDRALAADRGPLELSWCNRDAIVPLIRSMLSVEPAAAGRQPARTQAP